MAKATLRDPAVNRPYKSFRRGHIDFSSEECMSILRTLDRLDQTPPHIYAADTPDLYRQIKTRLGQRSQESLTTTVKAVASAESLTGRKKKSIRTFLEDLLANAIPLDAPCKFAQPKHRVAHRRLPKTTIHSLLRDRELGMEEIVSQMDDVGAKVGEEIRPWISWKGASSDVVVVAWAPDSLSYAAGAAAQSDDMDLQYNRPNNCLFGQLKSNTISELPDHCIARPRPDMISSGPNSDQAVYNACDPVVYKTVTSVQFSPSGSLLYTASHDQTVKIWDIGTGLPSCANTLYHNAAVTSLELSSHHSRVFATAAKSIDDSIRVYRTLQEEIPEPSNRISHSEHPFDTYSSPRAKKLSSEYLYPECIRWGLGPGSKNLLLAGFQQWSDQDFSATRQGDICLWDVSTGSSILVRPHASAIFAAAWHPQENIFITGGAPGTGTLSYPKVTQSVVRIYDPRQTASFTAELECPALDMQDVTFHPFSHYITAGCTDGTAYIWDARVPDYILHRLKHGDPLQELAANEEDHLPYIKHRERVDAGVMLSIWGQGGSLFYTGSSDGIVKAWDVLRAPEDVWVKDVAMLPAGIQSGALSPDGMNMLVGDAVGGVHVLSAAPLGCSAGYDDDGSSYNPDPIAFVPATTSHKVNFAAEESTDGIDVGRQLLALEQLVVHPSLGVGKGPKYCKYFALHARWNNLTTGYSELLPEIDQVQAFSVDGVEQPKQSTRISNLVIARQEHIAARRAEVEPLAISFGNPTPFVANRQPGGPANPLESVPPDKTFASVPTSESETTSPKPLPTIKRSTSGFIDLETYVSPSNLSNQKRKRDSCDGSPCRPLFKRHKPDRSSPVAIRVLPNNKRNGKLEVVDLTGDDVELADTNAPMSAVALPERESRPYAMVMGKVEKEIPQQVIVKEEEELEGNLLSYEEWIEEDHWWPE
ncbi:MAG: hypothetical protein Q9168_005118 [Polycauliona sp. 1 TL-2023]